MKISVTFQKFTTAKKPTLKEGEAILDKTKKCITVNIDGTECDIASSNSHKTVSELTTNPTLTAGTEASYYMKGDKFIIAYNDGGTMKYRCLDLTSTDATWAYTTVAP